MKYWDASALVPIFVDEPRTSVVRRLLQDDSRVITWLWSRTELVSAIERRVRDGSLPRVERRGFLDKISTFASGWEEVSDSSAVSLRANMLLAIHPLRSVDAGQLAAAILAQAQLSKSLDFVCLDKRLCSAAEREGFRVLPELSKGIAKPREPAP